MAKILIVEDAQDQLELFAKTFRRAGFDVYGAHDGGHAMDRVRDVRPDIILLDQMMPEVDGITFLQNLRRFPRWKNTPVVLVTGLTDRLLRTRATALGVQDILVKGSFQLKELIELVKQRLGDKFQPRPRGQGHQGNGNGNGNGHAAQSTPQHPATPDEATSAVA